MSDNLVAPAPLQLPDKPWLRLAQITALFVLFGPALAAVVGTALLVAFAMIGSGASFGDALAPYLDAVSDLSPMTFHFAPFWGVLPALVAGLIVGWYEGWRGPVTVFSAFLMGAGLGALFYMISEFIGWESAVFGASFAAVVSIPVAIVMTAIARLLSVRDRARGGGS